MKSLAAISALLLIPFCASLAQPHPWTRVYQSESDTTLYGVHVKDAMNAIVVGDTGVVKRTSDGGATWTIVPSGTRHRLYRIRFMNPTDGYIVGGEVGARDAILLKSTDGGDSWVEVDTKGDRTLFDVWFHNRDTGIVVGQAGVMRATVDGGKTWTSVDAGFGQNNIYSIDFPDRRIGYICGNVGKVARSSNGGASWREQTSGSNSSLFSISFGDPYNGTIVGDGGVILHTSNGGSKWETQYAEFPISSSLLEVLHLDVNTAYACGWFGIIIGTTDAGTTWKMQEWSGTEIVESLHFSDSRNGYAVGWNGTILRTVNGGGIAAGEEPPSPARASGITAYPNPVSARAQPFLNVEFSTGSPGRARLTLHDALGRICATVVDDVLPRGRHASVVGIANLAPGVYYLRTAGDASPGRPVVVVR